MTWKICRNISNLRKMMSKFVEKCKICRKILSKSRKMMSNLRKMMSKFVEKWCRNLSKNDVEICRKMRNLSKNAKFVEKWCRTVEMAKNVVEKYCRIMSNYVEIGLNCEICRKILSKSRKMMSKSIEMAKFVEICRIMSKFVE